MSKTWIKICGTTNLEDALASVEAGADALGFIFAESPRRVSPEQARDIIKRLPAHIETVGVFVNLQPGAIARIFFETGLTGVQLHGDEDRAHLIDVQDKIRPANEFGTAKLRLLKSLQLNELENKPPILKGAPVDHFLIDSGSEAQRGGTGQALDWRAAPIGAIFAKYRCVLAGGLTPKNVGEAIQILHPFGVDVVSGVEKEKGKKDHAKLRAFVAAVRQAESAS